MLYEGMLHRKKFLAQRREMMREYAARHHKWTWAVMPSMPDDQWEKYTRWVAAYGYPMNPRRASVRRLQNARAMGQKSGFRFVLRSE